MTAPKKIPRGSAQIKALSQPTPLQLMTIMKENIAPNIPPIEANNQINTALPILSPTICRNSQYFSIYIKKKKYKKKLP